MLDSFDVPLDAMDETFDFELNMDLSEDIITFMAVDCHIDNLVNSMLQSEGHANAVANEEVTASNRPPACH